MEPVAYRYVDLSGERQPPSMYSQDSIGLSYTFDKPTGRLRFSPQVNGYTLAPEAEIDPATLPQTVTVSGAVVRVTAWDGKRATLAVEKPFPQVPLRVEYPNTLMPKDLQFTALVFPTEPLPGLDR